MRAAPAVMSEHLWRLICIHPSPPPPQTSPESTALNRFPGGTRWMKVAVSRQSAQSQVIGGSPRMPDESLGLSSASVCAVARLRRPFRRMAVDVEPARIESDLFRSLSSASGVGWPLVAADSGKVAGASLNGTIKNAVVPGAIEAQRNSAKLRYAP
jgi:hypothetical protein